MDSHIQNFQRRIDSIRIRIKTLSSLRKLVTMPDSHKLTENQWSFLESQLSVTESRLLSRLKRGVKEYLPQIYNLKTVRSLNSLLGEIELEMSKAFVFFDTYMDVLTQRNTPELGQILAGCDVLAWDALNKNHPALAIIEPPLVFCDRGFGASILREDVLLPDGTPNPMPLIQIPYSRLKEKYNLTSILHEAGHQAMVRLGLDSAIPKAFRFALTRAGAPEEIKELFALWSTEIGPDFWTFCASGIAQVATTREILALPPSYVYRFSWIDPHPSAYLRVLICLDWCRQMWGKGEWDSWEEDWLKLYPLDNAPGGLQTILKKAKSYLPVISRALFHTKFKVLNRKTIPDLFNLSALNPVELQKIAMTADSGKLNLKGLSPCEQLAVFRLVREQGKLNEDALDKIMTKWLSKLSKK